MLGVNLKGIKEVLGEDVPEEETTGFWMREVAILKEREIEEIFTVSMINNKWLRKVTNGKGCFVNKEALEKSIIFKSERFR